MPEILRKLLLSVLKVPPEPAPPEGRDLRTFKAAPNYFYYCILSRIAGTLMVLGFFVVGLTILSTSKDDAIPEKVGFYLMLLGGVVVVFNALVGILTARLDYEMRWYMVTDSGLRIREGVVTLHEITMAFKNIQNISVTQGPIQRLLGISDLVVQTAGGSSAVQQGGQQGVVSSHVGFFRGVENAEEIRELIMARQRRVKGSGVGEEQPARQRNAKRGSRQLADGEMKALRRVAEEAQLLRQSLS